MELILLRHGESTGVEQGILQGRRDYPLTAAGKKEIEQLAVRWKAQGRTFARIISSPLARAQESAAIIGAHLGCEVLPDPLWMERDFGQGEGVDLEIVHAWYTQRPKPDAFEPRYERGESEWQIHIRAAQALDAVMAEPLADTLVVSHGNVISAALHVLFGLMPYGRALPVELGLEPACYADLHYAVERGRWRLVSFNDRGHFV